MGINKFIIFLFLCSLFVLLYEKKTKVVVVENQEKPEISFYNATVYDIATTGVKTIMKSDEAYLYKKREELVNGTVISKGDSKKSVNILNGDYFIKMKNKLYIDGTVNLQLENDIEIATEQLEYNIETKIAKNSVPFKATQYDHIFNGTNLYMSLADKHIKSNNIKMKIKVRDE